jgi:hypothetical protein
MYKIFVLHIGLLFASLVSLMPSSSRHMLFKAPIVVVYGIGLITSFVYLNDPLVPFLRSAISDCLLNMLKIVIVEFGLVLVFVIQREYKVVY